MPIVNNSEVRMMSSLEMPGLEIKNGPVDFIAATSVDLGNVSTLHISGGNSAQLLSTDGTGNVSWVNQFAPTYQTRVYTGNGANAAFTVSNGCTVHNVLVFLNGICQTPTVDYLVSGTTLTLDAAPTASTIIQIRELPR